MKRVVIVSLMAVLGGLYLYSAFSRGSRSQSRSTARLSAFRKILQAVIGAVLLAIVFFLGYAALFSSFATD